jgi:AcrR family transcriptional regulator
MTVAAPVRRRPGRPRGEHLDDRVLTATLELLLAHDDIASVTISAVIERSGVSRAAIYRRWESREALIAVALDSTRAPVIVPDSGNLREDLIAAYMPDPAEMDPGTAVLIRKRLIVALQDPQMQHAYWREHVSRRREPVAAAIRRAQALGKVRADVDIEATIDLIAGVQYYQLVVRGADPVSPETRRRVSSAISTVWRGMTAGAPMVE